MIQWWCRKLTRENHFGKIDYFRGQVQKKIFHITNWKKLSHGKFWDCQKMKRSFFSTIYRRAFSEIAFGFRLFFLLWKVHHRKRWLSGTSQKALASFSQPFVDAAEKVSFYNLRSKSRDMPSIFNGLALIQMLIWDHFWTLLTSG